MGSTGAASPADVTSAVVALLAAVPRAVLRADFLRETFRALCFRVAVRVGAAKALQAAPAVRLDPRSRILSACVPIQSRSAGQARVREGRGGKSW